MPSRFDDRGQALIEYLIIFLLFSSIALGLAKGLGKFMTTSFGGIGAALTSHLETGVCESECLFTGYVNQ